MTIENQIAELIAQAEPLRALPDVEAEAAGLPGLVDRINALRAEQEVAARDALLAKPFIADPVSVDFAMERMTATERLAATGAIEDAASAFADRAGDGLSDAPIPGIPVRRKPGPKPKVAE